MTLFQQTPVEAAREILGWTLSCDGCAGRIVETEAYAEHGDEACHTFFRQLARDFVETHDAGALYVYLNYGVHWLLNFLTVAPNGERGFVLIRALEPVSGLEKMHQRRQRSKALRDRDLCSGPGKLTQALALGPECHGLMVGGEKCPFNLMAGDSSLDLVTGPRIGITKAVEKPWRFGIRGNQHLSQKFPGPAAELP